MAPEVLVLDHFTPSCDVFSFGVFMWYLLTLKNPFEKDSAMSVNRKVVNDEARPPITLKDMKKLEAYKGELYDEETRLTYVDLIRKCWAQKIEERMDLPDAVRVLKKFEDLVIARDESKEVRRHKAEQINKRDQVDESDEFDSSGFVFDHSFLKKKYETANERAMRRILSEYREGIFLDIKRKKQKTT